MFIIRRTAIRALSSSSISIPVRTRSLTTLTPPIFRASRPTFASPLQRRFNSEDAAKATETKEQASDVSPEIAGEELSSAGQEGQSTIGAAWDSASKVVDQAAQGVKDTAESAAAAFGAGASNAASESRGQSSAETSLTNLYLGNLFFDVTEDDLRKEFSRFGKISSVKIIFDGRGLSKGFGYVDFEDPQSAAEAIKAMNQQIYQGRRMSVQYTIKRDRRFGSEHGKNVPSKTLFIGNLSFEMSDQDLNDLFREIRNVIDVRVAIDRRTGQPRGFAHADFIDVASAEKAMEILEGKQIYGRTLRLDFSQSNAARPRTDRRDIM